MFISNSRSASRRYEIKEKPKAVVPGPPEIVRDEIEEGELIGKGQYGEVFRGRCRGYDVAIKVLKKRKTDDQMQNFRREVEIMSRIRFPNVCLLLGACTDPSYFCIVQEYLSGGTLAEALDKGRLPTSFYGRMRWASHVARGMLWIHSNGVLHRDLKLENLILDKHNEVKVADFGLSDTVESSQLIWDERGRKGSPLYMAPEVLQKKGLDNKVDIYAFGLILWELLACKRAFQHHLLHNNIEDFINAICNLEERPPLPPEGSTDPGWENPVIIDLIKKCWAKKAKSRPNFQEVYDDLNIIITEGFIPDPWGRSFWLVNFPDHEFVSWDEFIKILYCKKTIVLDDGTTLCKGLAVNKADHQFTKIGQCVKILLAQISGVAKSRFTRVSCENFGKLLEWFGPGIELDPNGTHRTFLERVYYICSQPWFHGYISNPDVLLQGDPRLFLVRLSVVPGTFTIQTLKVRSRIVYTAGQGYQPEMGDKQVFKDYKSFVQWIDENMKEYSPLLNSEFTQVLGQPVELDPRNLYVALSSFSNKSDNKTDN